MLEITMQGTQTEQQDCSRQLHQIGFEVLMAACMKMDVFWVVALCSQAEVYHCFRGPFCLHHQGDE
jgi:hypothetical protein